jgi:hypothetical protein
MADQAVEITLLVTNTLEALDIPYLIGGSLASVAYGIVRTTVDADLVVDLPTVLVSQFVQALQKEFYVDLFSILDAIEHRSSFNLLHFSTGFKVDIFITKQRPFDQAQFERREMIAIGGESTQVAWVASAEDTILAKLEWFRRGGEVSERQWRDVLGVLKVQDKGLDLGYLRKWASSLQVLDLLERALSEVG